MVTQIDVVRYNVALLSARIYQLKADVKKWADVWIDCKVSVRKVVEHINPRHKRWSEYKGLKREATLNLLALRRLKSEVLDNSFVAAKKANVCQVSSCDCWRNSPRCECSQVTRKLARIAAQIGAGKRDFSDVDASVREPVVIAQ